MPTKIKTIKLSSGHAPGRNAVKPAKPREYLTITHKSLDEFGMCRDMRKLLNKTFPFSEFGARGIPVTQENALRLLKARLPPGWVLHRYTGADPWNNCWVAQQYNDKTIRYIYAGDYRKPVSMTKKAAVFVRLLTENANSKVRRITAPSKLTSLKGVTLIPKHQAAIRRLRAA